jgi:hypothetical protein
MPSHSILARGIAILSPKDTYDPEIGRYWATRRALHAIRQKNDRLIDPKAAVTRSLADWLRIVRDAYSIGGSPNVYLSQYAPVVPDHGKARKIELSIISKLARTENNDVKTKS